MFSKVYSKKLNLESFSDKYIKIPDIHKTLHYNGGRCIGSGSHMVDGRLKNLDQYSSATLVGSNYPVKKKNITLASAV